MARRRPTARRKDVTHKTRRYLVEALESRKYLVVLHEGDVFEFWADGNHMERVVVNGNIGSTTVELIGSTVSSFTGLFPGATPVLSTMNGVITAGPDAGTVGTGLPPEAFQGGGGTGGGGNNPTFTDDIYAIYVSQSDASTRIAVAGTPPLNQANRPMQPYTGNVSLLVGPDAGGPNITVSVANTGTALLGARTVAPTNQNGAGGNNNFPANEPIYSVAPLPAGTQTIPNSITALGAGLTVAQGNNLGTFLFGGTMLGTVNIHGSVQTFYGGWILTGQAIGSGVARTGENANFIVDGDVQSLVSNGSIGTNTDSGLTDLGTPTYTSGFNLHVGGKLGMIKSADSLVGSVDVANGPNAPGLAGVIYQQIDRRTGSWDNAVLAGDTLLHDDSFLGAQFLAPINNNGDVVVQGQIESNSAQVNKSVDYYAVPLMAGQTITTRLDSASLGALNLGVFDPERRLMATDFNFTDPTSVEGTTFTFTAKLPGVYYFAVAAPTNNTFTAGATPLVGTIAYTLFISGAGNLGIGGIVATTNILDTGFAATINGNTAGFHLNNGDLGAVFAGNLVISDDLGLTATGIAGVANTYMVIVDNGNLRDVEGASLGNGFAADSSSVVSGVTTSNGGSYTEWPTGLVPNGSVGMLRATGTSNASGQGAFSILTWNLFDLALTSGPGQLVNPEAESVAVGGDYQFVDGANFVNIELVANGNIGTVRANDMGSLSPSYFQVNAANDPKKHGTIDLIDVNQNFGTLNGGGPAIVTGPGGDCRYIHVGAGAAVFRDSVFGGGQPESTLFQPGETALITDDSGTNVSMTPENAADSLTVTTYPIRGSGGSAILRVSVAGPVGQGLNIVTSGGGSAEIGTITVNGTGVPPTPGVAPAPTPTPTPTNSKFTIPTLPSPPTAPATATNPIDINLSGDGTADVYEITGPVAANGSLGAGGQVNTLTNSTPNSEMVYIHLRSIVTLSSSGAIGETVTQGTPAVVSGIPIAHKAEDGTSGAPYTYPLYEVSSLVRILGNTVSISAGRIGNIYTGVISNVGATATDPVPTRNNTALPIPAGGSLTGAGGAVGSISGKIDGAVVTAGTINSVQANGIGWAGSGAINGVGIYSTALIGPVNVNGDMYGTIVSTTGQMGLTVNNGSIIGSTVADYTRFDYAEERRGSTVIVQSIQPFTRPQLDLVSITVKGNGGILGANFDADHMGTITVADTGFGIFDSFLGTLGEGTFNSVTAGGYGLRDVVISGGASAGSINARGSGTSIPVTNFPLSVRPSDQGVGFDPVTGRTLSILNDLNAYLGTSAGTPIINGATESGVIENSSMVGSRDVGSINAWSIRGRSITETTAIGPTPIGGSTAIDVGNSVNQVNVTGPVNGFTMTSGRTGKFNFGGDVSNFAMNVAGPIGNVVFKSSLLDSSSIAAQGLTGRIGTVTIMGNFSGSILAQKNIQKLTIHGSMIGAIHAASLGTLVLTGGLGNGSLEIDTSVGTIQTIGDLGVPGNTLTINGNLGKLQVGGNLNTNVSVAGNLKTLMVASSILSATNVSVVNTINLLEVNGDVQAGATITAHLIKKKVIKGQMLGTITTA
jgi:hypothetical protein